MNEIEFWEKASTAMLLVREGVNTTDPMMARLGFRSREYFWDFIHELERWGLTTHTPGKNGTMRLTKAGEQAVRHLTLTIPGRPTAWQRANP